MIGWDAQRAAIPPGSGFGSQPEAAMLHPGSHAHARVVQLIYALGLNALQRMKDKIVMAAGRKSLANERFYAQVAPLLAAQIGCETVLFPGHQGSFGGPAFESLR
jgi:hypothetical protein